MSASRESAQREMAVYDMVGDRSVLCAIVATRGRVVVVVNSGYPQALAHADQHLGCGNVGIWVCAPDCSA